MNEAYVHPTAIVEDGVKLAPGVKVWQGAHVRAGASLGEDCVVGGNAYVGALVHVGARCKIQNNALVYEGATLADGVFIGPAVVITNDHSPRAITPEGTFKTAADWTLAKTNIGQGASIGAGAVLVAPLTIGDWAIVGAGAVVTHDVPKHGLVAGNPAKLIGFVCSCGTRVKDDGICPSCGRKVPITP